VGNSVRSTVRIERSSCGGNKTIEIDRRRWREEPQEEGDAYKYPYSLFVSQERTVTETFSIGKKRAAWMFREEEGQAGVDSMGVNMNSEHLYGPWESGLRVDKLTSWRLQAVNHGMSCD
jgi:hypothetical protein